MRSYPIPFNEEARLSVVMGMPGLTADNDAMFEAICHVTRQVMDCPIAHITVVEGETQWYKAIVGTVLERMSKDSSFCTYTIMSDDPLIVADLTLDPRFRKHPMVVAENSGARYYAGVPLILSSGYRFGSLCVIDSKPHARPAGREIAILQDIAKVIVSALEAVPATGTIPPEIERAHETFLALIGHELRSPLTVLYGSLKLLEVKSLQTVNPVLIRAARKSAEHLMQLTETIIQFSNVYTGDLRLNETRCSLTDIFTLVAALALPGTDGTLKTIVLSETSQVDHLFVDPDQIKLALTAIVLNAVNHGGATITIDSCFDADGNCEICVTDNGHMDPHLDPEDLCRPFVVGSDMELRSTKGGLGLGLPLTRKLIELHGGEFEIVSKPNSTSAIIRLPAWRAEIVAVSPCLGIVA